MKIISALHYRQAFMPTTAQKKKYKQKFARRIAQARDDADLTQAEVAAVLGVPKDTYSKWEIDDGTRIMPHEHIAPFCVVVKRSPWYILTGRDAPK